MSLFFPSTAPVTFSSPHRWFSCSLIVRPLTGSVRLRLNVMLNWPWHSHFPLLSLSLSLSQTFHFVPGVSLALLFHFMSLLRFPSPSPPLYISRIPQRACKGALIERNINLQVTNSSCGRAGGQCVKPGPPRLPCPFCNSPWHCCETPQPLGLNHTTRLGGLSGV